MPADNNDRGNVVTLRPKRDDKMSDNAQNKRSRGTLALGRALRARRNTVPTPIVLSHHVYKLSSWHQYWLAEDRKTWTPDYLPAASFDDARAANAIARRFENENEAAEGEDTFYVITCMAPA